MQGVPLCPYALRARMGLGEGWAMTSVAGKSILLVEDDKLVGAALKEMLSALGYSVIDVEDGKSATEIIESTSPIDVLLTDLALPGSISGIGVVRSAVAHRPGIRKVLMSGFLAGDRSEEIGQLDNVTLLPKPFTLRQLRAALQDAL